MAFSAGKGTIQPGERWWGASEGTGGFSTDGGLFRPETAEYFDGEE